MHRGGETYCKYPVQLTSFNKKGEARTQFSSSVNNSGIPCLHFDRTLLAQFLKSVETDPFFLHQKGAGHGHNLVRVAVFGQSQELEY